MKVMLKHGETSKSGVRGLEFMTAVHAYDTVAGGMTHE